MHRPRQLTARDPNVPPGDASGTQGQTKGRDGGCGNKGTHAGRFMWRQETAMPQQAVVKAGFGEKSNGGVKTDTNTPGSREPVICPADPKRRGPPDTA